LHNLTTLNKQ